MSTTPARIAGFVVNCIKYLAVFVLALAIPVLIVGENGDPASGAALLFITLAGAAWYGKRLFGIQ